MKFVKLWCIDNLHNESNYSIYIAVHLICQQLLYSIDIQIHTINMII